MEFVLFFILFCFVGAFMVAVFMLPFKVADILKELREIHARIDECVDCGIDTTDKKMQKHR